MSSPVAKAARRVTHELRGVVVSAGMMDKTAKVRVGGQKWNKIVHKVGSPIGTVSLPRSSRASLELASLTRFFLHSGLPILSSISSTIPIPPCERATSFPSGPVGPPLSTSAMSSNK